MNVRLVGLPRKSVTFLGVPMPSLRPEISLGNLLSMAVSCIAIFSTIVTLAVIGTNMRAEIDKSKADIVDIKTDLAKQKDLNDSNLSFQTEVRVDLKYMREALDRIENHTGSTK